MDTQVYEGGLTDPGKVTFPKSDSEGETEESYGGELGIKTTKGGPATNDGGETKDFLNDASYRAKDMEVGRPSSEKVVNPDDLSNNA